MQSDASYRRKAGIDNSHVTIVISRLEPRQAIYCLPAL